ncbi:MAG: hypothetical protein VKL98_03140 [Cyanobacteriota bacterium]|nr:hypothetical protein [Cyanobacteriota bacterium]
MSEMAPSFHPASRPSRPIRPLVPQGWLIAGDMTGERPSPRVGQGNRPLPPFLPTHFVK